MNTSAAASSHILSAHDAARYIGRSEITVRQWRSRGLGPPYIRQGRSISYLKADLDQYLEERRCAPKGRPDSETEPTPPLRRITSGYGKRRKRQLPRNRASGRHR
jgi:hypothetical protein